LTRREQFLAWRGRGRTLALAALVSIGLSGCTDAAGYDLDYLLGGLPNLGGMRTTVAFRPNTLPMTPPEGTVPVRSPAGEAVPFTQAELETVAAGLANPIPASTEVLARGGVVYQNQCVTCHGVQGEGNGPVVGNGRFPLGPSLLGGPTVARTDGYLYGVVRVGRGLMPAYGERMSDADRWAVVHYLRQLQGAGGTAAGGS
jgi:mono/diheme cytochrome c family protein